MRDILYGVMLAALFAATWALADIAQSLRGIHATLQSKPACAVQPALPKSKGMV